MKNLFKILIVTLMLLSFSCSQVDNKTHSVITFDKAPINVETPPLLGNVTQSITLTVKSNLEFL